MTAVQFPSVTNVRATLPPVVTGQYGVFQGLDARGCVTMKGTVARTWCDDVGNWFAAVKVEEIVDKHCGLVRYARADVTRRLQVAGVMVDVLHGRRPSSL